MSLLTGRSGSVTLEASLRCDISSFTATHEMGVNTTVTSCSSGWQVTGRGNEKVSGSLTFKVDSVDPVYVSALDSEVNQSTGLATLVLQAESGQTWSGEARLGNVQWTCNIENAAWQECTVSFESDGTWTFS
jgi:hypothetical protein